MASELSDIIVFDIDDFLTHKTTVVDDRVRSVLKKIIEEHECFSQNYRYTPSKDQNYQHKLNNYYKKNCKPAKLVSDTDTNTKKFYSLFNKLSKQNYVSILKSIKCLLKSCDEGFISEFLGNLLTYCELSDLYIDAIIEIIVEICTNVKYKAVLEKKFETYFSQYIDSISPANYHSWLDEFDYDDYDSFCDWKKKSKMLLNKLNSIIKISKVSDIVVNLVKAYEQNMNSIQYLLENKNKSKTSSSALIHDHFEHLETLLREKKLVDTLGCDIQKLHLLCIEVMEEEQSKKLKFKIDDLMKEQSFERG